MNTKKKILFLVTQSEFGGAQRFIYRLITNLDLAKYDIMVAAGPEGNDANGLLFNLQNKDFKIFPLKFLKRAINPFIDFLGLSEIYRLIKKEKPDIVFLCSSKAGFLGSLATSLIPKPYSLAPKPYTLVPKVIYRIGGWTFNDPWPKWKRKIYTWLEKNTARFKDFIVNNAESDRQQAISLGIKPKREILTIYNGIDVSQLEFLPKEEAIKNIMQVINNMPIRKSHNSHISKLALDLHIGIIIGTVANLYPAKGLEYLIEAAKLLEKTKIKFIIVGEGQERKRLENLIKNMALDNVLLVGAVPDFYRYLRAFDAFVLPSLKEGFPWTVIEAMAAEIPVIATNVGAIPEIIENNKNGILIEPRDPKTIADSIEKLMNDKNLVEKFIQNGKKTVIEKFNLQKMVSKFEELFI
jgi:glycosyltransferase involved in cell wall biosynthesis